MSKLEKESRIGKNIFFVIGCHQMPVDFDVYTEYRYSIADVYKYTK
jgi:hypothetical protein